MKKILIIGAVLVLAFGCLLAVRFLFGGDEDTWICTNGQWIKHGAPRSSMPEKSCLR